MKTRMMMKNISTRRARRQATLTIGTIIAVLLLGYIYLQSRQYLLGPQLSILSPENGSEITENPVIISGQAKNIAHISLNDFPIFVDEAGFYKEKLLLHEGYNIMSVKVRDKFGREKEEVLELVFRDDTGSTTPLLIPANTPQESLSPGTSATSSLE